MYLYHQFYYLFLAAKWQNKRPAHTFQIVAGSQIPFQDIDLGNASNNMSSTISAQNTPFSSSAFLELLFIYRKGETICLFDWFEVCWFILFQHIPHGLSTKLGQHWPSTYLGITNHSMLMALILAWVGKADHIPVEFYLNVCMEMLKSHSTEHSISLSLSQ